MTLCLGVGKGQLTEGDDALVSLLVAVAALSGAGTVMRYYSVPQEVKVLQIESKQRVITSAGERDAKRGDWLVHYGQMVEVLEDSEFHSRFMTRDELKASLRAMAVKPWQGTRSKTYDRVEAALKGGCLSTKQIGEALDDVNPGTLRNLLRRGIDLGLWERKDGVWSRPKKLKTAA